MNPINWIASTASSWTKDDMMVAQAKAGVSADVSVYKSLEPRFTKAPPDVLLAYEQATYFVALAARRADAMGETAANVSLLASLDLLLARWSALSENLSWLCLSTGYGCPGKHSAGVLADAVDAIESSGLNADDRARIVSILTWNRRVLQVKQVAPLVALVGVGAIAGTWYYRRRSR